MPQQVAAHTSDDASTTTSPFVATRKAIAAFTAWNRPAVAFASAAPATAASNVQNDSLDSPLHAGGRADTEAQEPSTYTSVPSGVVRD